MDHLCDHSCIEQETARGAYETSTQQKLLRKCVAAENALWAGCRSGMENRNKETGSAHRGPEVRKRTPVEDAAGAGRQTGLPKVESVEPVASRIVWLGEFVGASLSITSKFDD
tara:strand:+ start:226 stop:564 length:339 start_codon:yes stop_codon:yes gene_type:complete